MDMMGTGGEIFRPAGADGAIRRPAHFSGPFQPDSQTIFMEPMRAEQKGLGIMVALFLLDRRIANAALRCFSD